MIIISRTWTDSCKPVEFVGVEIDVDPLEYVQIKLRTMDNILLRNECWFDKYGNLCSKHGHLAPSHFADLGQTFHVKRGCAYSSDETAWLKA